MVSRSGDRGRHFRGRHWSCSGQRRSGRGRGRAETPITGTELDQASAAALDHLGEGRVSDTEVGDEEGYYEVEVTLDDGSEVDVHLDAEFTVLGTEAEGADEESGTDD